MKRICKKCGEEKEIEEFSKEKSCKLGFSWRCKECRNKYKNQNRKLPKNKKNEIAYNKKRNRRPDIKARAKVYNQSDEAKKYQELYRKLGKRRKGKKRYYESISKNLKDAYIKDNIRKQTGIQTENITPQMIELKRELITFHRIEKEIKKCLS